MTKIKGVIFDKDGTLFDFSRSWEAWAVGFLHRITNSPAKAEQLGDVIGFDLVSRRFRLDSIAIAGTPDEIASALAVHMPSLSIREITALINQEAETSPQFEAVPLDPLLTALKQSGLIIGLVTNDAEQSALAHLDFAGIRGHFDFVAGCDSGFGSKPAPGQLNAFLEYTGLEAQECVMVGDSTHDLRAGRQAATKCIGVLTGLASKGTLAPFADDVLPDIGHLPAWLAAQSVGP